jgi:hypothetical protein
MLKMFANMMLALICLGCLLWPVTSGAECRKARHSEVPHGANELIELPEKQVNGLFGTIFFPGRGPAEDTVVEVYRLSGNRDHKETVKQTRIAACVTGPDGTFSFVGNKPGRYLLQAGIRRAMGINLTYVVINLRSNSGKQKGRGIEIPLHLGT